MRARIVLACAGGALNGDVAKRLHVTSQTVGKWRQRFVDLWFDGLLVGADAKLTHAADFY